MGIIFFKNLSFDSYINSIYIKALRVLGLKKKKNYAKFNIINCIVAHYCALVRSV